MKYHNKRVLVNLKMAVRVIKEMISKLWSFLIIALQFTLLQVEQLLEQLVGENGQKFGGLMSPKKVLGYFNKGIRFGELALSEADSMMHTIIFGKTGSGKSTFIYWCNLLINRNASLIIRDVAGDFIKAIGWLKFIGYKVVIFNLKDFLQSTHGMNVLEGVLSKAEIARIAKTIVTTVYKKSDYWSTTAEEYCTLFITLLKEQAEEYHNLFNLKYLIEAYIADPGAIDYLISKSDNDDLVNGFFALGATPDKTKLGSLSTLKSCFAQIDEQIAMITSKSTFNWQDLRKEKTAVFIQSSVLDDKYLNVIQTLLWTDILKSLMNNGLPKNEDLPIYCFLDECGTLSLGEILQNTILVGRKYKISLCMAFQNPEILRGLYTKEIADTLESNAFCTLYLPGMSLDIATYLSKRMGTKMIVDKKTKSQRQVPVMAPFAIQTLKNKAVMLTSKNPPALLKITPYFKIFRMKKRLAMPMPTLEKLTDKLGVTDVKDLPKVDLEIPQDVSDELAQLNK